MSLKVQHIHWQLRRRLLVDAVARNLITLGGFSVFGALLLIFVFFIYKVIPLFISPSFKVVHSSSLAQSALDPQWLGLDHRGNVGWLLDKNAKLQIFATHDFKLQQQLALSDNPNLQIDSVLPVQSKDNTLLIKNHNQTTYQLIQIKGFAEYSGETPAGSAKISMPFGKDLSLVAAGENLLDAVWAEQVLTWLGATPQFLTLHTTSTDDLENWQQAKIQTAKIATFTWQQAQLSEDAHYLYVLDKQHKLTVYDIQNLDNIITLTSVDLNTDVNYFKILSGGSSALVVDGQSVRQLMLYQTNGQYHLTAIRQFKFPFQVKQILTEQQRKGFVALGHAGEIAAADTTSERQFSQNIGVAKLKLAALSARSDEVLLLNADKKLFNIHINNPYPELSWKALWGKVWYEDYPKPEYIWQSSSASTNFEPKYSLMPLVFGTVKAAFYAMLFAVPIAIFGAIYTAFFMHKSMRQWVKPTVELLEALPTVILGFLAGLWLAPLVEQHLLVFLTALLIIPLGIAILNFITRLLAIKFNIPKTDGWHAATLIPIVILMIAFSYYLAPHLELSFFGGDIITWMREKYGITYAQRNSLVVGFAMGIAVIPMIFSIAEDAIFSVPKQLSNSALALGATPWQTLVGVVLPTASPGIFSAMMMGLGRAVGETMIVLMAAGNTPIMSMNIFQGLRALSANIAVELPEAAVDSTHYRLLFMTALLLFGFTFIVNSAAETVRQRLRKRYGTL